MKRVFSHVIKIALVLAMIICWVLSIGYTNRLTSVKNTFNIYFDKIQVKHKKMCDNGPCYLM